MWILDAFVTLTDRSHIVLCSGRPERCRADTVAWLTDYEVPHDMLLMRPDGDFRADNIIKSEMLDYLVAEGHQIDLVLDDRPRVISMWRERGLFVLAAPWHGDEEPSITPGVLTLMVGPSGAGKSVWLDAPYREGTVGTSHFWIDSPHVISSDQIRQDLCGDFRDQSRNDDVFAALHAVVRARITAGLPACVDATNIRRADRMALIALVPPETQIRYIVIDRPLEEKMRDADWRAEVQSVDKASGKMICLVERHHRTFQAQLKDILRGDGLPNVTVYDLRKKD